MHNHQCRLCGKVWSHGDDKFGNANAHACPSCGRVEWYAVGALQKQSPMTTVVGGAAVFLLLAFGLKRLLPKA